MFMCMKCLQMQIFYRSRTLKQVLTCLYRYYRSAQKVVLFPNNCPIFNPKPPLESWGSQLSQNFMHANCQWPKFAKFSCSTVLWYQLYNPLLYSLVDQKVSKGLKPAFVQNFVQQLLQYISDLLQLPTAPP